MKNKATFWVILALISISCEKLISEKVIETKTFTPTINYSPSFFIETKDGLIFNLTKNYYINEKMPANLRCENAISQKFFIYKTDFEGNILFEKSTDSSLNNFYFFRKDDSVFSFINFNLNEYDNNLAPLSETKIDMSGVTTDGFQLADTYPYQLVFRNKNDFTAVSRLHKNSNQSKMVVVTIKNGQVEKFATNEMIIQDSENVVRVIDLPSNDLLILTSFYAMAKQQDYFRLHKYNAVENTLTLEAELPLTMNFESVMMLTEDAENVILLPLVDNQTNDTFEVYLYNLENKTLTPKPINGMQKTNSRWSYNRNLSSNLWIDTYDNGRLVLYKIKPDLSFQKVPVYLSENSYQLFGAENEQQIYMLSPMIWGDKTTETRLLWQNIGGDVSEKVLFKGSGLRNCFLFD